MTEVDPDDPAFAEPTKFVGPVYNETEAIGSRRPGLDRKPTAQHGVAWFRRRSRSGSSSPVRSSGCWSTAAS